jgi:hypothetical protein
MGRKSITGGVMPVRRYSCCVGLATRKGVMDGKDISAGIRYTRVYVRRDGRWQVVQFQQTRVVPGSQGRE